MPDISLKVGLQGIVVATRTTSNPPVVGYLFIRLTLNWLVKSLSDCDRRIGRLPRKLSKMIRQHSAIFEMHNCFLGNRKVINLFQCANVFVSPYRHASQSSTSLITAVFGVPIVATAVGPFVKDVP